MFSRLGEDEGSMLLSWTTLNPMKLVRAMNAFSPYFDFKSFEEYMRRVRESCEFQSDGERQMRGCFGEGTAMMSSSSSSSSSSAGAD